VPTATNSLPHYDRPPVIEVVCGIQFEAPSGFSSVHFGRFHDRVRGEYPSVEDNPPLAETFEGPLGVQAQGPIFFDLPPLRRVFLKTADENFLLQVQPTRFLANWRRVREGDQYPRFSAAFERFTRGWLEFRGALADSGLSAPRVNQYELTYINHIGRPEDEFPSAMSKYLRYLPWNEVAGGLLKPPKAAMSRVTFPLGSTTGSLHVTVSHGVKTQDQKSVMIVDLTARGAAEADWSDMQAWFDTAHEHIVRGFTELTSDAAHRGWGRKQ
jgi:uncharacterized protein (TIGR04255 family)